MYHYYIIGDTGVSGRMDHYRNGKFLANIAYDQTYSYKKPPVHDHPRAIKILPGKWDNNKFVW